MRRANANGKLILGNIRDASWKIAVAPVDSRPTPTRGQALRGNDRHMGDDIPFPKVPRK